MSEAQSKNLDFEGNSSSNNSQIVVTCPACSTKFSILKAIVENLSAPRFHCARCENIFTAGELNSDIDLTKREHSFNELPSRETEDSETESSKIDNWQSKESEMDVIDVVVKKAPARSITDSIEHSIERPLAEPNPEAKSTSPIAIQKETLNKAFEIPTGFVETKNVTAPRETHETGSSILNQPKETKEAKNKFWGRKKTKQLSFAFDENSKSKVTTVKTAQTKIKRAAFSRDIVEEPTKEMPSISLAAPKTAPNPIDYDEEFSFTESFKEGFGKIFDIKLPSLNLKMPKIQASSSWKDFLFLTSPIFLFLSFLFCLSLIFTKFPSTSKTFTNLFVGTTTEAAPSGVYINNLKHQKITLDSGDEAHLISGKVVNSTKEELEGLKIQGLGMNSNGIPILSATIPFQGALAKAKTKALTPKMIDEIQKNSTSMTVSPGERQDFTIALVDNSTYRTGDIGSDVSYYTARIYSVLN